MPRNSKTHNHGYKVALLLYLSIIANAYEISYEYDSSNPWEKIIDEKDHNNYEAMELLFGMIHSNFDDMDHLYGMPMSAAQKGQGVNILSRDLPVEMSFSEGDEIIPIGKLPEKARKELYKALIEHPQTKGKFVDEFSWCAHGKIPKACKNAAELIFEPYDNPHSFFSQVDRVDGSEEKAQTARRFLLKKAKSLKEEARLREESKKNKQGQTKETQDKRKSGRVQGYKR